MARRPSVNLNLPTKMRARTRGEKTYYYYDKGGKPRVEIALGTDYILAIRKWAELHESATTVKPTVAWAIAQYQNSPQYNEVSDGTKKDYGYAFAQIASHFGDAPLDEVRPSHITLYIDKRSAESKHRALREKAVFSMVFAWCMAREYCTANPVALIKTKRLPGRKHVYIDDDKYQALYERASIDLQDAIDLAYYTGQRPADVLKMRGTDIKDGHLWVTQNKTGKPLKIKIAGDLAALMNRIATRKQGLPHQADWLLVDEQGRQLTKSKLRIRFDAARSAAGLRGAEYQFRDLRRKAAAELKETAGIAQAQAMLGHSTPAMTEHYAAGKATSVTALPKAVPQLTRTTSKK